MTCSPVKPLTNDTVDEKKVQTHLERGRLDVNNGSQNNTPGGTCPQVKPLTDITVEGNEVQSNLETGDTDSENEADNRKTAMPAGS